MLFNSDIVNFVWKTDQGKAESSVVLIFCSLAVLLLGEGWWGGTENQNLILFQPGFYCEAISIPHSGLLYRLNIFTFCFHEPLLFQIFVPWKSIKMWVFLCLLPLLQSRTTQITFSINILICFKYTVRNQFSIKIHVQDFYHSYFFQ